MYLGALKKNKKLRGRSFDIHSGGNTRNSGNTRNNTLQRNFQSNCGAIETGASFAEKDFTSSLEATTLDRSRPFEFYVWSDEGISLNVDLNSSPSDWTNRFRHEVCANQNVHIKKSGSLWQDLCCLGESSTQGKSSFLWNTNSDQIVDHNGQIKSSSSLKLAKDDVTGLDQMNKGGDPSIYDSLTPCSITVNVAKNVKENQSTVSAELTVNVADNSKEYESTVSAEVSYGAPNNYISGSAESCAIDGSKNILDSDVTNTPFIKSKFGSVDNSPSDPDTLEHQNSMCGNEVSEDCAMLSGSCSVNPDMMCPGVSLSGSLQLQVSEVASCHKHASLSLCENDRFPDSSEAINTLGAEEGGLVNSSKINLNADGKNLTSLTEEWEVGKAVDGRETSECSQFDDPLKKSCLESGDQGSKMKLRKRRKRADSEVQGPSDKPAVKFLRSMKKNIVVTVLPRRSIRLISK